VSARAYGWPGEGLLATAPGVLPGPAHSMQLTQPWTSVPVRAA